MFERFTDQARQVIVLAQQQASSFDHNYVGTEHLLLALLAGESGVAARALNSLGVTLETARAEVDALIGRGPRAAAGALPFTPNAKKAMMLALQAAVERSDHHIGTEHLLLGLVREGESAGAQVLGRLAGGLQGVRERVMRLLSGDVDIAIEPEVAEASESVSAAPMTGDQPRCPRCNAQAMPGLRAGAAEAVDSDEGSVHAVNLVWCRQCGAVLGVLPPGNG